MKTEQIIGGVVVLGGLAAVAYAISKQQQPQTTPDASAGPDLGQIIGDALAGALGGPNPSLSDALGAGAGASAGNSPTGNTNNTGLPGANAPTFQSQNVTDLYSDVQQFNQDLGATVLNASPTTKGANGLMITAAPGVNKTAAQHAIDTLVTQSGALYGMDLANGGAISYDIPNSGKKTASGAASTPAASTSVIPAALVSAIAPKKQPQNASGSLLSGLGLNVGGMTI